MNFSCKYCSKNFHSPDHRRQCCSRRCHNLYLRQTGILKGRKKTGKFHICLSCNKEYYVEKYREEKTKYCSRSCLAKIHLAKFSEYKFQPGNKPPRRYKIINGIRIHRYIMGKHIGRKLNSFEHVHHVDGNPDNNSISNLVILTNSEHGKISSIERGHTRHFP